jgi:hypothetical protein
MRWKRVKDPLYVLRYARSNKVRCRLFETQFGTVAPGYSSCYFR